VKEAQSMRDGLRGVVLITRRQGRTVLGKSARAVLEASGLPVLETVLSYRVAYQEAIAAGRLAVVRGFALSPEDRLRADVIERLMCDLAVDLRAAVLAHDVPGMDFGRERAALGVLAEEGLVRISGDTVAVPEAMRPFVRKVAAVFDAAQVKTATHAPAV